jgi:hypothetical protein
MTLVWRPGFSGLTDADAIAYVAAVEAADGQALEFGVGKAINDFIVGCKLDGTWNAIKASCILAGARTLNGALVPLVGTAPTNVNFVSGDYNRKTGLGDPSNTTKYLNSNRSDNADPQNSFSLSLYQSQAGSNSKVIMGSGGNSYSQINTTSLGLLAFYSRSSLDSFVGTNSSNQFIGSSRSASASFDRRYGGTSSTLATSSATANGRNLFIFADNNAGTAAFFSNARLAFYSIGESLDLAKLDTRVTALITAIGAAIP